LLLDGELPGAALVSLVLVAAVVYFDVAFVRRNLCRTVCPYGRIQTVLVDPGTLTLHCPPDQAERCIRCEACVRACPTGIDVRDGYQVECIHCGRCLDACREVMAARDEPGIVAYSFGVEGRGPRALLNPRTGIVCLAAVGLAAVLVFMAAVRSPVGLNVRRSSAAIRPLPGGGTAVFFTAYASNRSPSPLILDLTAQVPGGPPVELRGPVRDIHLAPEERRQIDFAVVTRAPAGPNAYPLQLRLSGPSEDGTAEARATVELPGRAGPDG
jgi:polyferredoxin